MGMRKYIVREIKDRWVVLKLEDPMDVDGLKFVKGTAMSNWSTKEKAQYEAWRLSKKKPIAKMSWNEFKEAEGIDNIRED